MHTPTSPQSMDELHSIQDVIRWAYSRFNQAPLAFGHGTDNSWDEAVNLVLQALHLPWDFDPALMHCRITATERATLSTLIEERIAQRIPVAYLVKQAWFCQLPFYVDQRVLIPRSPIAELIDNEFQPWLGRAKVTHILDLCTGSGCIGIASAYQFEKAQVDLLDYSPQALEVANINIEKHQLQDRVRTIESDVFNQLPPQRYTLITSNPPYVDAQDLADMPTEFTHEPKLGLAAGQDGLAIVKRILAQAAGFLSDDGLLIVEVGNSQDALIEQFPQIPFIWVDLERGGHGILLLTAEQCRQYQPLFQASLP